MSAESVVLGINISIIVFAYFWLFPRIAEDSLQKLMNYDSIVIVVAVGVAGVLFYDTGVLFEFFSIELNWFFFTLLSYFILEVPFALWYFKKYDIFKKL